MLKKLIDTLTCSHRHGIEDHPACFAAGNVNEEKAEAIYDYTGQYWYNLEGARILYFDIEVDNFEADFGTMLACCVKEKGKEPISLSITKEELFNGEGDKRLLEFLCEQFAQAKVIISYYGSRMDVPWIRTKALRYGLKFPALELEEVVRKNGDVVTKIVSSLYHYDLYYLVKYKLKLSRSSMENACEWLGLSGKVYASRDDWRKGKYGDPESIEHIRLHCVADVRMLEELHEKLEPFQKFAKRPA